MQSTKVLRTGIDGVVGSVWTGPVINQGHFSCMKERKCPKTGHFCPNHTKEVQRLKAGSLTSKTFIAIPLKLRIPKTTPSGIYSTRLSQPVFRNGFNNSAMIHFTREVIIAVFWFDLFQGFGAGNFKSLFEAIEKDQDARGNLTVLTADGKPRIFN